MKISGLGQHVKALDLVVGLVSRFFLVCALDLVVGFNSEGRVPRKNLRNAADEDSIDSNFIFIVRTSNSPVQIKQGNVFKSQVISQGMSKNRVHLIHEVDHTDPGEFSMPGYWTLTTYLRELADLDKKATMAKWYVFVEPNTIAQTEELKGALSGFDHLESHFLGKRVGSHGGITQSSEPKGFPMPLAPSGFALSYGLVNEINTKLKAKSEGPSFYIDIFFELACFIKRLAKVEIVNVEQFCSSDENTSCAIKPGKVMYEKGPHPVDPNDVIVVVKTSVKFHADRLPIQKETWIADAPDGVTVVFMSETADETVPTVDLIAKWPAILKKNSETAAGHCAKFTAIIYELQKEHSEKKWFVVVDGECTASFCENKQPHAQNFFFSCAHHRRHDPECASLNAHLELVRPRPALLRRPALCVRLQATANAVGVGLYHDGRRYGDEQAAAGQGHHMQQDRSQALPLLQGRIAGRHADGHVGVGLPWGIDLERDGLPPGEP
jgi:hypothetical protein